MNDATPLSQALASSEPARSAASVTPAANLGADAYAIWKSIFESARPSEPEAGREPGSRGELPADRGSPDGYRNSDANRREAATAPKSSSMFAQVEESISANASGGPSLLERSGSGLRGTRAQFATGVVSPRMFTLAHAEPRTPAAQDRDRVFAATAAAEAVPASAESVRVFVRVNAVAVVVRNSELPDEDALQCAFEAARELTGERAALRVLTLNGRTLYRHSELTTGGKPSSVLVFAC